MSIHAGNTLPQNIREKKNGAHFGVNTCVRVCALVAKKIWVILVMLISESSGRNPLSLNKQFPSVTRATKFFASKGRVKPV